MNNEHSNEYERLKQAASSVWYAGTMYIGPSMPQLMQFLSEYKRLSPEYEQPASVPDAAIKRAASEMYRLGYGYHESHAESILLAAAPQAPQVSAIDWRELCRRLYVELFACNQQMTNSFDTDGDPMWFTGAELQALLDDAKSMLATPPQAPEIPAFVGDSDDEEVARRLARMRNKKTALQPDLRDAERWRVFCREVEQDRLEVCTPEGPDWMRFDYVAELNQFIDAAIKAQNGGE